MNTILIFHGYKSSCENPRYHNLPYETIRININYDLKSWIEIYQTYDEIIKINLNQKKNLILLGHSLGGWWARYFAKKYHLTALLLNPVIYFPVITLEKLNIENYIENSIPFGNNNLCELWYYIEKGDSIINFENYMDLIKSEGIVNSISGGNHQIQYPEVIPALLTKIVNEQGTTLP